MIRSRPIVLPTTLTGVLLSASVLAGSLAMAVPAHAAEIGTVGYGQAGRSSASVVEDLDKTSLPSPASAVRALRLPTGGVDLSWDYPLDGGGSGLVSYVVHRYTGGEHQAIPVPITTWVWNETDAPADVTYAVSVVNETGEGPAGDPLAPTAATDPFFVRTASVYRGPESASVIGYPGGSQPVVMPPVGDQSAQVAGMAMSPDGRHLATTRPSGEGEGVALWREPVDRSSPPVKLYTPATVLGRPAWSPDGTKIAVAGFEDSSATRDLVVLPAAGGAPTITLTDLDGPTWLPDSRTLLARDRTLDSRPLVRVDTVTGKRSGTVPGADGALRATVSPDGRLLAFSGRPFDGTGVRVMPVAGGVGRQVLSPDSHAYDLAWNADGTVLAIALPGVHLAPIDAAGVPGPATRMELKAYSNPGVLAWGGARVALGPSPAHVGRSVTVPIDVSALPAGVTTTCRLDAAPAEPCTGSYLRTGLTSGTHSLLVRAVQPDGRVSVAARTFTADATAPTVRLLSPTAAITLGSTVTASYSATDANLVASYDVRSRKVGPDGRFSAQALVVTATKATSVRLTLAAGYRHCVSVRARDSFGNVSGWTAERCTSRPLDDRALTAYSAGWTRGTSTSWYLGTATYTTRTGATLTKPAVVARQVTLVATTCSSCGSVTAYLGSTKLATVSLRSTSTRYRTVLPLPASTTARSGTLRLVVTSTGGRRVQVDGVAFR